MAQSTTEHQQPRPAARPPEEERPGPKTPEEVVEKMGHPEQPVPTQAEADELKDRLMGGRRDERQQPAQPAQPAQPVRRDVQGEHGPGYQTR